MLDLNLQGGSKARISDGLLEDSATHDEGLNVSTGDSIHRHLCSPRPMRSQFAHYELGVLAPSRQPPHLCQHHHRLRRPHSTNSGRRMKMMRRHPLVFSVRSAWSSFFATRGLSAT